MASPAKGAFLRLWHGVWEEAAAPDVATPARHRPCPPGRDAPRPGGSSVRAVGRERLPRLCPQASPGHFGKWDNPSPTTLPPLVRFPCGLLADCVPVPQPHTSGCLQAAPLKAKRSRASELAPAPQAACSLPPLYRGLAEAGEDGRLSASEGGGSPGHSAQRVHPGSGFIAELCERRDKVSVRGFILQPELHAMPITVLSAGGGTD